MKTAFIQSSLFGPAEIIIAVVFIIILFIVFRWLILWYYQIDKRKMLLEDIKAYTMFMAKQQHPESFRQFDQLWEEYKRAQKGKMPDPRK